MLNKLRRCLLWRRCSIRFWFYKRPVVSLVVLAALILGAQIILVGFLGENTQESVRKPYTAYTIRPLNKVARVAVQAKEKIPGQESGKIIGASKELRDKYIQDENGLFHCINSEQKIDFDRLNDDYCDCVDGTDEPSTSACPSSRFYCGDGVAIPSSRVNDGVCDCCDGSDEYRARSVIPSVNLTIQEKINHFVSPCKKRC